MTVRGDCKIYCLEISEYSCSNKLARNLDSTKNSKIYCPEVLPPDSMCRQYILLSEAMHCIVLLHCLGTVSYTHLTLPTIA